MFEFVPRDVAALVRTNAILGVAVALVWAWLLVAAVGEALSRLRHHHT